MLECLIMGDSIAVGVSQVRKECTAIVQKSISSANYLKKFTTFEPTRVAVISLGTNDNKIDTKANVEAIRNRLKADHVFWILPIEKRKPDEFKILQAVAAAHGDTVIVRNDANTSPDGVHPTAKGYKELADKTKVAAKK